MHGMNIALTNRYHHFLYIIIGVALGVILLATLSHPSRWTWFVIAGMSIPWLIILTPNPKLTLLFLLVLSIPINTDLILNYRLHPGGAKGWTFSLIDVPLFILYAIWLIEILFNKKKSVQWWPKVTMPLAGFILLGIFSLVKATHHDLVYYQLFVLIKKILLILYIGNHVNDERALKYVILALLIGFLFECSIGLLQYQKQGKLGLYLLGEREADIDKFYLSNYEEVSRVSGTFWHGNGFAFYLQMVIPVAIGILLFGNKALFRILSALSMVLGLLVLILTLSRGAWLSFIISIFFLGYFYLRKIRKENKLYKRLIPALIIFLVIFLTFRDFIYSRLIGEDYGAAESRIWMMQTSFNIIKQNPLLGIGMNNYVERMAEFDKTGFNQSFYYPVHNQFLLIASETGILSLLLFLSALYYAMKMSFQAFKKSNGSLAGSALGVLSGFIGFIGHAQVDLALIDMLHILWLYLGAACALFQMSNKSLKQN